MVDYSASQLPNVPGLPNAPKRPGISPTMIIAILGALAGLLLIFLVMSIISGVSSNNQITVARQQGVAEGSATQAKQDEDKLHALVDSPAKTYVAPGVYGGLEVKYPKTWNASVTDSSTGNALSLILHPEVIRVDPSQLFATRIVLSQALLTTATKSYEDLVKKGTLRSSKVTVSGIAGLRYDGIYEGKKEGAVTLVQVRDKVISMICEDKKYLAGYNDIVAQMKITP
jgi:hypothetical protein